MGYHSFLYAWYKGEVPAGYDVDHIDDNTLNNDLSNLQLLTHAENIKKRGGGKNQYTAARENGLPKPVYESKKGFGKGRKLEKHSDEFLEKQAIRQALMREVKAAEESLKAERKQEKRLKQLEAELAAIKDKAYKYPAAKEKAIKRVETEIQNLKKSK